MRHPGLIILAAGASRRMGRLKQLLPWGDSTLLRHACTTALGSACSPVILVLGCEAERCRLSCEGLPLTIVVNRDWDQGLGTSLAIGVTALLAADAGTNGVLVMLADQPNVSAALLEMLVAHWSPPAWPIAAVAYEGRGGVPALFDRSYFSELRALRRDSGARALIARENPGVALVNVGPSLIDLDTPEAYHDHRPASATQPERLVGDFTD